MVSAIVETSILIDLLRGYLPAVQWYTANTTARLGITPIIWMEVIDGAPNKLQRMRTAKLAREFDMLYLDQADFDWAMDQQFMIQLQYGTGMMDCLIASISYRLHVPLYTQNMKHFRPLLGNLAQKPY